jgi:hypothetical protein
MASRIADTDGRITAAPVPASGATLKVTRLATSCDTVAKLRSTASAVTSATANAATKNTRLAVSIGAE